MMNTSSITPLYGTPNGYFITGTDTDAGKTLITAGLLRGLLTRNPDVLAVKAVQTGCIADATGCLTAPDTTIYVEAGGSARHVASLALFEPACSPHLAAKWAKRPLSVTTLHNRLCSLAAQHALLLVEGAGGVLVPLNETETMLDLMTRLALPVVLVVHNRLGCLNHALLSLESLHSHGLVVAGIVCNNPRDPSRLTELEQLILNDNVDVLTRQGGVANLLTVPYLSSLNTPSAPAQARQRDWDSLAHCLASLIHPLAPPGKQ